VKRRDFIVALGAFPLARALPVVAQTAGLARIGWISSDRALGNSGFDEIKRGLRDLGYVEGRNLSIDARWGDGSMAAMEPLVTDLIRTRPDLVVAQGPVARIVGRMETSLPIVFAFSGDPVAAGFVESFARPGRNMTGMSFLALDLVGKRMELLKELLPALRRVAILANPDHPGEPSELRVSQAAAKGLGLAVDYFAIRSAAELEQALTGVVNSRCEAIVLFPDTGMMRYRERIAAFAISRRVPAISGWSVFAASGNVMSYGPNQSEGYRRLATYVDRILKGAKPADLPVELPTKVELVVNLKAAREMGLTVPKSILLRADEVIQ
jgi:putative ABC transport system substrate-binding protein